MQYVCDTPQEYDPALFALCHLLSPPAASHDIACMSHFMADPTISILMATVLLYGTHPKICFCSAPTPVTMLPQPAAAHPRAWRCLSTKPCQIGRVSDHCVAILVNGTQCQNKPQLSPSSLSCAPSSHGFRQLRMFGLLLNQHLALCFRVNI